MVVRRDEDSGVLEAGLTAETRRRSTLAELEPGMRVNVEVPLALGDPLGGHLVQGRGGAHRQGVDRPQVLGREGRGRGRRGQGGAGR
ncbi:hypothetical protein HT134_00170 [Nonomuraea rhodomycinica]|uniref:Lumazine-binding domain-containing protein n=2 Tax=Nonomuraea rhodomycinica TaxID=1712872 RepID=A0A7Y6IHX3_9ACTN|nr:hypothetical protein [Nonomuraea rhodomycinica]